MKLFKPAALALLLLTSFCAAAQNEKDSITVDSKIFTKTEVEAGFPGGINAWRDFLINNLNVDVAADNGAPAGHFTVIARFIVSKNGDVTDVQVESAVGFGMDEEVLRVIKKSGKWIPAIQNGRPVNAYRRQPITFAMESDEFEITTKAPYVFFMGADNELSVTAFKVKPEDLSINISKGTVKQTAPGKFIVNVTQPGRVMVEVVDSKKNKSLGLASFVVMEKK